MKKRILSWLLTAALVIGLLPAAAVTAVADELAEAITLSDDYISVSVSKSNGGFTVRTVEGDRLKKSDNNKDLLYHDGQYDTSFVSFRVGEGAAVRDYIFGGKYSDSSDVSVKEVNGAVQAEWSVEELTFTQSISLANNESNESGMVSVSLSAKNESGDAVPVQARILYDTALGNQDFGYYQYSDGTQNHAVQQELVLDGNIPSQIYAVDDPYSPSMAAYTVTGGGELKKVAFGHWSHLASTLFDFTPVDTLDFTDTRSEYMTADSACALYFDLGAVAAGGEQSLTTFYGVFSNHNTPAGDSVAVNLTAPVRLTLNDSRDGFVKTDAKLPGDATFSVTVDFTNIAGEGAQDLSNLVLAVRSSGNLRSLGDNGIGGQSYTDTDPFLIDYDKLAVGESRTKILYFEAQAGTDATYERIIIGVYKRDANGQFSETNKLGEHTAYILLPGSDGDVPKVNFAAMTPKIIYTEGTRHLFVTVTNESMLTDTGNWNLKVYSEDKTVSKDIPHTNITIKDGVMDVALTDDIRLSEGGWYLQLEWTDAAVSAGIVMEQIKFQTAPELHFTVSADKKYKNDAYGIIAVVEYVENQKSKYEIKSFKSEAELAEFEKNEPHEEILLIFKGEFTKETKDGRDHYVATSTVTRGTDGKSIVDNSIVINGCMDFEDGSLEVYFDKDDAICTEFDGKLYTNAERTSIWSGKAIFTKIEQGKSYSLIPYNENGERGSYEAGGLNTDHPDNFEDGTISLIWPSAAGIGQTLSGMIFKLAYGQLGVMYDTGEDGELKDNIIGRVVSFTASLDLTFASGTVDKTKEADPTYWSKLKDLWSSYNDLNNSTSLYNYVYNSGRFEKALDWSEINEEGDEDNRKNIKGSVMVRDVLFGCGEGFVGVNFEVGVAIKNYISGLPEIEGTIAVNTINDWAFGIEGKIELANFSVEAKVAFKSRNNIPIPDELYVFVSGFEPGLNIDGCGVVWITGGGGGIKNIYDTIFCTQAVPPLKLLLSVSFDVVKVLTCEKATISLGLTGISLQAENIGIKAIPGLTAIEKMGLSLEWYPGIDLRANIALNLFQGVISGGGYIVLLSPDYKDVFFEMFARAQLKVPSSIPVVGGMQLAGIDLGVSSEKIWGALEVLFITLGVTYYWGEGSVDFGSGSKADPTFPDLLGYDDIPVCYDAENDQTLYMRVGTNTQLMASTLPDNGGVKLMDSSAYLKTDGDTKAKHEFNLGTHTGSDAIVQIVFDAESAGNAEELAKQITVKGSAGDAYSLVRYDLTKTQEANKTANANANLTYDETTGKATYAFTVTDGSAYDKDWALTTPAGSDVLLYNVAEVPEVTSVSGTLSGSDLTLNWTGSSLGDLDQISFYLCGSSNPESADPGYRIGVADSNLNNGAANLTIPADVPSGDYYIRAVYSKSDEVNGVVFSTDKLNWTNDNTPDTASFTAKAAGNLQYQLTIPQAANTDGYLVTIYNADGSATDFEQVSYEAAENGDTVINVGGRYTASDADGNTQEFGLTGGGTYTIGVTPYKTVTSGEGESAVYGREVKKDLALPEMATPTVTFSADQAKKTRTETRIDSAGAVYTAEKDVYTANGLTLTAAVSEPVTGTWRLDNEENSQSFTNTASVSIPLTGLAEGEHTVTLQGAAADGDSFAATYAFTMDTLPPQLLLAAPVNGSFFGKDGKLTVTGVTDADARFTISGICSGKTVAELGGTFDAATGEFSFEVNIPDSNSASQHALSISVSDDVGNATAAKTVEVSHGGLADLAALEVMVDGLTYGTGNIPVPAAGLNGASLTLVGVTSDGTRFNLTGYNVIWNITTVEGTASLNDGKLTAAAGSHGMVTGKLAVADGAYRTATLTFGAITKHTVAVSATIGGTVSGGGEYVPGATVTLTATPDSGYRFAGWTITGAQVSDLTAATVSFTMPDSGNVTALATFVPAVGESRGLYAAAGQFVRVKTDGLPYYFDSDGSAVFVPVTAVLDGTTVFLAPRSTEYFFRTNPVSFTDIAGHWAGKDILFAAEREIFRGVGDGKFDPNGTMTRAMFVTVLYRIAGSPAAGSAAFDDVAANAWYADAVAWGAANGIVKGYGDSRFGPNNLVTREQMCALIVRYLEYAGFALPAGAEAAGFADVETISAWAGDAVAFCQTRGLVNGRDNGCFDPQTGASRAENCAVFHRLIEAVLRTAK